MPQALAIGGVVASVAGAGVSAASAIQQGDYAAAVAQRNAAISRQSAGNDIQAGAVQEQQQLFKTAAVVSAARAAQGSSGLDVNSGSAVTVRASSEELGNQSAAIIRSNAARAAYGEDVQASADIATAAADKAAGQNQAIGDILSGLGSAGSMLGQLKLSGALPGASAPAIAAGGSPALAAGAVGG